MGSRDDVLEAKSFYEKAAEEDPELKARCDARMAPPEGVPAA